jgi:RHS repeat-associated protein
MMMPGRKYQTGSGYRYGFNGKENDKDAGEEIQDYGLRIYDGRLGRFLSVDPLSNQFAWNSVYCYAEGDPVNYIDLDGGEKPPLKAQVVPIAKRPIIEPVHSEAPPLALQQAKQRAMSISPILTPEQKKAADQAAIIKQLQSNQTTIQQGGYLGSFEGKIAKANYETYGKYLPGISDVDDFASFIKAAKEGNGDEATIYALGFLIPDVSGKMLKGPLHHIFTNKNFKRAQQWSKKFAPMFEKAGYKLDDAINKIHVPGHKGPHPDEYHDAVYQRLKSATEGLGGEQYKKAFDNTLQELQKEVTTQGSKLNKLLTKTQ